MGIGNFMTLFSHLDAETKERLAALMGEALASGNVSGFLRARLARLFVEDPWHWEMLGLKVGASREEIERAHKALLVQVHPDRHKGDTRLSRMAERAKELALKESGK